MESDGQIWWERRGDVIAVGLTNMQLQALEGLTYVAVDPDAIVVEGRKTVTAYKFPECLKGKAVTWSYTGEPADVTEKTALCELKAEGDK